MVLNISPLPDVYLEHVEQGLGEADGVHGDGNAVGQREHQACAPTNQHMLSRKHQQLFRVIQIQPMCGSIGTDHPSFFVIG